MLRDQRLRVRRRPTMTASRRLERSRIRSLRHFFPPLRHFDDVTSCLQGIVDGIASAAHGAARRRLRGRRRTKTPTACGRLRLPGRRPAHGSSGATTRWCAGWRLNAQIVCRPRSTTSQDRRTAHAANARSMSLGAEVIVPLHGRGGCSAGCSSDARATGIPFDASDLQDVLVFAEHVAMALENAMLYEEVALQKTLRRNPAALPAHGHRRRGRRRHDPLVQRGRRDASWLSREDVLGQAGGVLGSRIADRVRLRPAGAPRQRCRAGVDRPGHASIPVGRDRPACRPRTPASAPSPSSTT